MSTSAAAIYGFITLASILFILSRRRNQGVSTKPALWSTKGSHQIPVYGLQHGKLNLRLPTESMWMNMGFWKDQEDPLDFPLACKTLLKQVVSAAGVLETGEDSTRLTPSIAILDVGFGCGDQIIELFGGVDFSSLRIDKYVGITSSANQFALARERLGSLGLLHDSASAHQPRNVKIFREDAAQPDEWSQELSVAVDTLRSGGHPWLLGLDSLYHLAPSRLPLLRFVNTELGASLMAFDLLLTTDADRLSMSQRVLLRIICLMTAVPYRNLMTERDYRRMLVAAGYSAESIRLEDISEHVFSPLVRFLETQHRYLQTMGMSLGAFRLAKLAFGWWADSGIVRGYIVVAKRSP